MLSREDREPSAWYRKEKWSWTNFLPSSNSSFVNLGVIPSKNGFPICLLISLAMCILGSFSNEQIPNFQPLFLAMFIIIWSTNSDLPLDGCPVTTVNCPSTTVYNGSTSAYPVETPEPIPFS